MNRYLTRGPALALAMTLSLALFVPSPVAAGSTGSTFNVTKTADTADGTCAVDDCSLREAVIEANLTVDYDVINLPKGHYVLAIAGTGEQAAATGDLDIRGGVDIHGSGARKTIIDGGGIDRVINVPYTGTGTPFQVWIENVTITGGFIENEIGGGIGPRSPPERPTWSTAPCAAIERARAAVSAMAIQTRRR